MAAKYRVAIIGTGRMGGLIEDEIPLGDPNLPYGHFSAYEYIEETEVVAVANRGVERLQRFSERFGITNTYLDYREMIDKEQPDIVSVTTPSFARAEPLIYCAEHGVRAIYSEKGLCASLAEADRIRDAMKRNNVAFNWGAMRRHNVGFRLLAEAIAAGEIGEPEAVLMLNYTDLIKHHPHMLDLVSMLLGDPRPAVGERPADRGGRSVRPRAAARAPGIRRREPSLPALTGIRGRGPVRGALPSGLRQRGRGLLHPAPRVSGRARAGQRRHGLLAG